MQLKPVFIEKEVQHWLFPDSYLKFLAATSKTWTQTLKNLGHEKLDPEKPGLRKTWFMKNAGNSWIQKEDYKTTCYNLLTLKFC